MKLLSILLFVSSIANAELDDLMKVYQSEPYDKKELTTAIHNIETLHSCDEPNKESGFKVNAEYDPYTDKYHLDVYLLPKQGAQYQGAIFDVFFKKGAEISSPLEVTYFGKRLEISISGKKNPPKSQIRIFYNTPPKRQFINGVSKKITEQYCQIINIQELINEHNK